MLTRVFMIVGAVIIIIGSLFFLQFNNGFYFMEKATWIWLINDVKTYYSFPDFITKQLFITSSIIIGYFFFLLQFSGKISSKILFGDSTQKELHGSARWAKWSDIVSAGLGKNKGCVVGGFEKNGKLKTLYHDGAEHIMCFAPTRSGKGVSLVLSTLLNWKENALILDIKGENYRKTAGYRKSLGQKIIKFNPAKEKTSAKFNPLAEVRLGTNYEIGDIKNISTMLIDTEGKGLKDHWSKAGDAWVSTLMLYLLYKIREEENRTANLYDLAMVFENGDIEDLIDDMMEFRPMFNGVFRESAAGFIYVGASSMKTKAPPERSGVNSTVEAALETYKDPILRGNISSSDFTVTDLISKDNPISVYLIFSPKDIKRLTPFIRIIMNIMLTRLIDEEPEEGSVGRLLLMLDEFTSIGKLEIFEDTIAYMASYGIKAFIIVQDLTQLHSKYGKDESITSNCHIRIAFAPNTIETAKALSDMAGKTTIVQKKSSSSKGAMSLTGSVSTSVSEVARPLLTPDECMKLPGAIKSKINPKLVVKGGAMLIFPAGFPTIYGRQSLYFQDKEFLSRSQIEPPEVLIMPEEETQTKAEKEDLTAENITNLIME
jgi:type IV secretion system protein VirD4